MADHRDRTPRRVRHRVDQGGKVRAHLARLRVGVAQLAARFPAESECEPLVTGGGEAQARGPRHRATLARGGGQRQDVAVRVVLGRGGREAEAVDHDDDRRAGGETRGGRPDRGGKGLACVDGVKRHGSLPVHCDGCRMPQGRDAPVTAR